MMRPFFVKALVRNVLTLYAKRIEPVQNAYVHLSAAGPVYAPPVATWSP